MKKRRTRWVAAALTALLAALYCNSTLEREDWTVTSSRLPDAFSGLRITLLTDLHGARYGPDTRKLLEAVAQSEPDLIAISGDLADEATDLPGLAPLVTGLAVCQTIRELCGIDARIKWPNDIVLGSKKLCGMLLEMSAEENHVDYVIAGIGINVNIGDFPEEIAYKATSLRLACGHSVCRGELLAAFLNIYEPLLQLYTENRTEEILVPYRELCVSLGRQVSTQRPQGLLTGTAVDITRGGELVIRTPTGEEETIFTGEVSVQGIYDRPEEKQA